jgi:phage-related protein
MARKPVAREKPLLWVGSSKKDLPAFPEPVKDRIGTALSVAQFGGKHPAAKPWKGLGRGYLRSSRTTGREHIGPSTRCGSSMPVHVLHAFQKKSPRGKKTSRLDIELISERLRMARQDYEERYGSKEKG